MVRVRDACHGAERVATIVRDLRTFARGDDSARGPVDLRDVAEAAINIAGNTLNQKARVVRDYADTPLVEGNANRLEQVFLNLLLNAAQAMPNGAPATDEIRVRLYRRGNAAIAEIEDTGEGIPEALMARIFEPFFTTKPVGVGTGLGLPICRSIVSAHGGTLDVTSEVGHGTTFRVTLPASQLPEPIARHSSSRAPVSEAPRGRVLVVDDEAAVGNTLKLVLQGEHDILLATSGDEALRLLANQGVDAILCDLMMPGMTGMELHEAIRSVHPGLETRMIFMTGGTVLPHTETFLARVNNPLLEKPFDITLVRRLLRGFVSASA
jgi:CheY-like chemotaxis protein/two-component sensor histidine kinase